MRRLVSLFIILGCTAMGLAIWHQYPANHSVEITQRTIDSEASVPPAFKPVKIGQVAPLQTKAGIPSHDNQTTLHRKLQEWLDAEALDSQEDQDRVMKELVAMLSDDSVAEMLRSLSREELNTPFSLAALHRWLQVDPAGATNWTASRSDGSANLLTAAAAEMWADHKPALLAYVDQLPNSHWKNTFLTDAGLELSMKDPRGAIDLAQHLETGVAQTNLLQAVVCDWVSREPNAALNWIIDVTQPELREQLTAAAAKSYALTEPSLAASWLVSTVRSDEIVKDAVLNIIDTWGARDPEKAAKWVTTTLNGDTKQAAVDIISSHWMKLNGDAATAWIQSLPKRGT